MVEKLLVKLTGYTPKRILLLIVCMIMARFGIPKMKYHTNNDGKVVSIQFYRDGWE